jgi:hypothetical protein
MTSLSTPISIFCASLLFLVAFANRASCGDLQENGQSQSDNNTFELSSKTSKFWIEDSRFKDDECLLEGPIVLRMPQNRTFVWEWNSATFDDPKKNISDKLPYFVVFEGIDSGSLKTDLHAGSGQYFGTFDSSVVFQAPNLRGCLAHSHYRDWSEKENKLGEPYEEMFFARGDDLKYFDLKQGRVFVISETRARRFGVQQYSVQLPDHNLLKRMRDGPDEEVIQSLNEWASSLTTSDADSVAQQSDEVYEFSSETDDFWSEDTLYFDGNCRLDGPIVLRTPKDWSFVWELNSARFEGAPELSISNKLPYFVVFDGINPDTLLTALTAEPGLQPGTLRSSVDFQAPGLSGSIAHYYEVIADAGGTCQVRENMYFVGKDGKLSTFNLEKGRVFVIRKSANDCFTVKQSPAELPPYNLVKRLRYSYKDEGVRHLIEDWYSKIRNSVPSKAPQ